MLRRAALILCSAASVSWAADSVPVSTQPAEIITQARSSASGHSYLLFPYTVTNPPYDTEITIANTSLDTFLPAHWQSGTCLLTFRGSGTVPAAQTTATIAAGKELVFKMSEGGGGILASPNFQGYITADCSFPLARGIATIFTPTLALSQAAEVITLPRPTTAPAYLLFQFVTNQSGFDTPIAIANTSGDLGLASSQGPCTFYFYGSPPHGTVITDPISPGTVYTNTIAFMAPGFEGYVIARCNFRGATGLAIVTDLGAHNLAFSETPERLTIPRTSLPWPTTTRLLFPAVTNQNGLDTPFSLANTTSDPCGSPPATGNCALSFFGENAPVPFVTPTVDPGTVYTNLLSNVAPNFQGYMIAECGGTLGRGWAITLKAGATVDGGEQTPEILPPNWIPRDTTLPYPSLLFTGVTNWRNDLDTKITISNTSRDQYGTPQSHGSCTINYFGDMANGWGTPSPQVSADIQAGQQLSFSLSQGNLAQGILATPGFRGYIITDCNFALARGLATVTGIPAGDTYLLTTNVYPPGGGSITPGGWFHAGTVVTIDAVANAGYQFHHFSGHLSGSAHPKNVIMSAPRNVVANYAALVPNLTASISSKSGLAPARHWSITLTNHVLATANANAAQITGVALTQTFGAACSPPPTITDPAPPPLPTNPLPIGNLAPGAFAAATVTINFSGCGSSARFRAVISFAANGGSYSGSTTLNNQYY